MRPFYAFVVAAWLAQSALSASNARAAVQSAGDSAFLIKSEMALSSTPTEVYARFVEWGKWWSSDHTYSGSAANLTLKVVPGGCLCEQLPGGGFVQHLVVVYAAPGKMLRLDGSLGPLMMMGGSTSLLASFKAEGQGTKLVLTLTGNGYEPQGGLSKLASAYDEVLSGQLQRFKRYAETGKP